MEVFKRPEKTWIGNIAWKWRICVQCLLCRVALCTATNIDSSWVRMAELLGVLQLKTLQNNDDRCGKQGERMRLFIVKSTLVLKLRSFHILSNICSPVPLMTENTLKSPATNCIYHWPEVHVSVVTILHWPQSLFHLIGSTCRRNFTHLDTMNKVVGWVLELLPLTQAGRVSSQTTEV